jgi:hypothetical protein
MTLVVGGRAKATEVATTNPHLGDNQADSARYGRIKIRQTPVVRNGHTHR